MSEQLDRVTAKVQKMLTAHLKVGLTNDGQFTIAYESTQAWVRVWETQNGRVIIQVTAPVLYKVKPTAELYKYVATYDELIFGHLVVGQETEDGSVVLLTHSILGDYLDEEELMGAVVGIVSSADNLDDELMARFGGERFID